MSLEEDFIRYKDMTLIIMEIVKAEEYERLDEVFQERQLILDNIAKLNYPKEELKKFYYQYDIGKLEEALTLEMKVRKEDLLEKIKKNQKRKLAMNGYNNLSARAIFLSKDI